MTTITEAWKDIWNGDLSLVDGTIHEDFTSHAAPLLGGPPQDSVGRANLHTWVSGARELLPGLRFTVQVGPITDGDLLVLRWHATADHPEAGPISFYGTDILRLQDGLVAEYWANADSLWAAQQLGVVQL
ncbi:ester cyclase [Lentzea sp. E54]|uniref:ester cyclase n=1 Tax=Lentzea xerophila TaxID=3435883 RepID=UPI003DA67950